MLDPVRSSTHADDIHIQDGTTGELSKSQIASNQKLYTEASVANSQTSTESKGIIMSDAPEEQENSNPQCCDIAQKVELMSDPISSSKPAGDNYNQSETAANDTFTYDVTENFDLSGIIPTDWIKQSIVWNRCW